MNIYEALKKDHRKVESLLEELVNLQEGQNSRAQSLIEEIRDELIPHSRAEEAVFYNSIRAVNTAQDLVWHGYAEHMEAEGLLRTLQALSAIDVEWKRVARKLQSGLAHHIREEEEKIIPVAEHLFTNEEAKVMAEAFAEMKPEVKDESVMQTTLDMIANMLPVRLAAPLRTYSLQQNGKH